MIKGEWQSATICKKCESLFNYKNEFPCNCGKPNISFSFVQFRAVYKNESQFNKHDPSYLETKSLILSRIFNANGIKCETIKK